MTTVRSDSIGQPGRALNTARMHSFVLDSSSGPGEGLTNTEAFLGGIASCGVTLIEKYARDTGVRVPGLTVTISGHQAPPDPTRFATVDVRFEFRGVGQDVADQLVEVWRSR
ncbi:MAG TPA: OsmC family protein [bacterium]|nr:OsmC family protein [bacterium]